MAMAPIGQIVRGGQVDPGVQQSIASKRQGRENRMVTAMQEQGASKRAGIAAGAQVATARIGAESDLARTAMQVQAESQANAARIKGAEEDRNHETALTRMEIQSNQDLEQMRNDFETARIKEEWEKVGGIAKDIQARMTASEIQQAKLQAVTNRIMEGILGRRDQAAELSVRMNQTSKELVEYQETRRVAEEGYKGWVGGHLEGGAIDEDLGHLRVSSYVLPEYFLPGKEKELTKLITEGRVTVKDAESIDMILRLKVAAKTAAVQELRDDPTAKMTEDRRVGIIGGGRDVTQKIPTPEALEAKSKLDVAEKELSGLISKQLTWERVKGSEDPVKNGGMSIRKYLGGFLSKRTANPEAERAEEINLRVTNAKEMKQYLLNHAKSSGEAGAVDPDTIDLSGYNAAERELIRNYLRKDYSIFKQLNLSDQSGGF